MSVGKERLENDFTYHKANENQVDRYEYLRENAKALANAIDERVPDGREKSLALTNLEQAIFWANAGIARNKTDHQDLIG